MGKNIPLQKIFCSDFDFQIPAYQRPYAWTEAEATELFDDLLDAFLTKQENYFLGCILLVKNENEPHAEVIDGQQRLTTLTLLLASIASRATKKEDRDDYAQYIMEPGRRSTGLSAKPRLTLRKSDKDFFQKYIQELRFEELFKLPESQLKTEAQQHIKKNALLFKNKLDEAFANDEEKILDFGRDVLTKCFIVAVSSASKESAFRAFSVLNNRGLDLLPCDVVKADIIGNIASAEQNRYTELWESIEEQTGRDEFNVLFSHIRMIYAKCKQKRSLIEEFKSLVMSRCMTPEHFINDILSPFADQFRMLAKCDFQANDAAAAHCVNRTLRWLSKIDNKDWMPPAILFFSRNPNPQDAEIFVRKLERLASFMFICSMNVNRRIERYGTIIRQIENDRWPESIELTREEAGKMLERINGPVYTELTAPKRNYLILRLDSFVSDGAAQYAPSTLTIEHVLPQTPPPGSLWLSWWPNAQERDFWLHRIANLAPLSRNKNSEAQNYEFSIKKNKYFLGPSGTSSYALTTQILQAAEWTPRVLRERQLMLVETFKKNWNLQADDESLFDSIPDAPAQIQERTPSQSSFCEYAPAYSAQLHLRRDFSLDRPLPRQAPASAPRKPLSRLSGRTPRRERTFPNYVMEQIEAFYNEVIAPGAPKWTDWITRKEAYQEYVRWCNENNVFALSTCRFFPALRKTCNVYEKKVAYDRYIYCLPKPKKSY